MPHGLSVAEDEALAPFPLRAQFPCSTSHGEDLVSMRMPLACLMFHDGSREPTYLFHALLSVAQA